MGWKYTKDIKREEALLLIETYLHTLSDEELEAVMSSMFGDSTERPHYGANFNIYNEGGMCFDEHGNLKDECK